MSLEQWGVVLLLAAAPLPLVEVLKATERRVAPATSLDALGALHTAGHTAVELHDLGGDGQAEASVRLFGRHEGLEQLLDGAGVDARSVVSDDDLYRGLVKTTDRDDHRALLSGPEGDGPSRAEPGPCEAPHGAQTRTRSLENGLP